MGKAVSLNESKYIYPVQVLQDISQHSLPAGLQKNTQPSNCHTRKVISFKDWLIREAQKDTPASVRKQHTDIKNIRAYYAELSAP